MASSRFSCYAAVCGLVLLAPVLVLFVQATDFKSFQQCSGARYNNLPAKLYLKGCEGKERCPLYRGDNASMEIKFVSPSDTANVYRYMYGVFGGRSGRGQGTRVPYGREANVCSATRSASDGEICSRGEGLKQGVEYIQDGTFKVMSYFPKVSVDVEIELYSKPSKSVKVPLGCVRVPVQIMDRP